MIRIFVARFDHQFTNFPGLLKKCEHLPGKTTKPGVSPFANRKLKKLLHLCALTAAIRFNEDIKQYYERKHLEGKNKMSVINAVRNKLLHRIFAVVRDERLYMAKLMIR